MSFSLEISRWTENTKKSVLKTRREILLRLFRAVVMDTPVDEGTLRANWQTNAVSPLTGPLSDRALTEVFREMETVLSGANLEDTIYLNNNLPYAYRIEFLGWSHTKAPQGMVRKNVIRLTQIAEQVARGNR